MDSIVEFIKDLPPPNLFIRITERKSRKKVTLQVVNIKSHLEIPYSREVYETIIRDYVEKGWSITESQRTSSVYILCLHPTYDKKMKAQNLEVTDPKGFLYVGMTGLPVEERIQNHVTGHKSCNLVHKHFSHKFGDIGNLFHYEAEYLEKEIPKLLRSLGYWVYQA